MRRTVWAGLVAAGLLGGNVQAGTVLGEEEDAALGWWSGGAGDEGIGSALMPVPVADAGDWSPRRGSLYGAIRRMPPHRAVVPPACGPVSGVQYPTGGSIGVLSVGGSGAQPSAGCLTVCVPWEPMDFSQAAPWPGAVVLTGGVLSVGSGSMMQGGSSAEIVSFSPDLGGLTLIGSGGFLLSDSVSGNIWTLGADGTLSPVVNTLSAVPEPGSLAAGGMAVVLAAAWLRARRRVSGLSTGGFARAELTPSRDRTYGYEAIT